MNWLAYWAAPIINVAAWTVPTALQKRVFRMILRRALGQFADCDVDSEDLSVELARGTFELRNLALRAPALSELLRPHGLEATGGRVAKIAATVPLSNLWTSRAELLLEGCVIDVQFLAGDAGDSGSGVAEPVRAPALSLAAQLLRDYPELADGADLAQARTAALRAALDGDGSAPEEPPDGVHVLAGVIERLLGQIVVTLRNVTLRLHLPPSDLSPFDAPRLPLAVDLTVEHVELAAGTPVPLTAVSIRGASVTLRELRTDAPAREIRLAFQSSESGLPDSVRVGPALENSSPPASPSASESASALFESALEEVPLLRTLPGANVQVTFHELCATVPPAAVAVVAWVLARLQQVPRPPGPSTVSANDFNLVIGRVDVRCGEFRVVADGVRVTTRGSSQVSIDRLSAVEAENVPVFWCDPAALLPGRPRNSKSVQEWYRKLCVRPPLQTILISPSRDAPAAAVPAVAVRIAANGLIEATVAPGTHLALSRQLLQFVAAQLAAVGAAGPPERPPNRCTVRAPLLRVFFPHDALAVDLIEALVTLADAVELRSEVVALGYYNESPPRVAAAAVDVVVSRVTRGRSPATLSQAGDAIDLWVETETRRARRKSAACDSADQSGAFTNDHDWEVLSSASSGIAESEAEQPEVASRDDADARLVGVALEATAVSASNFYLGPASIDAAATLAAVLAPLIAQSATAAPSLLPVWTVAIDRTVVAASDHVELALKSLKVVSVAGTAPAARMDWSALEMFSKRLQSASAAAGNVFGRRESTEDSLQITVAGLSVHYDAVAVAEIHRALRAFLPETEPSGKGPRALRIRAAFTDAEIAAVAGECCVSAQSKNIDIRVRFEESEGRRIAAAVDSAEMHLAAGGDRIHIASVPRIICSLSSEQPSTIIAVAVPAATATLAKDTWCELVQWVSAVAAGVGDRDNVSVDPVNVEDDALAAQLSAALAEPLSTTPISTNPPETPPTRISLRPTPNYFTGPTPPPKRQRGPAAPFPILVVPPRGNPTETRVEPQQPPATRWTVAVDALNIHLHQGIALARHRAFFAQPAVAAQAKVAVPPHYTAAAARDPFVTLRIHEMDVMLEAWPKGPTAAAATARAGRVDVVDHRGGVALLAPAPGDGPSAQITAKAHRAAADARLEYRVRAAVRPLQLVVHQHIVDELCEFATFALPLGGVGGADGRPRPPSGLAAYVQLCELGPVELAVDYKPLRVDVARLLAGNADELVGLFPLDGVRIRLPPLRLAGVSGWAGVAQAAVDAWAVHVRETQLAGVLGGVAPVRSAVALGQGLGNLVLLPLEQYEKDGRWLQGLGTGVHALLRTAAVESLRLGTFAAAGASSVLETVHGSVAPSGSSTADRAAAEPENWREGLARAYLELAGGLRAAADTVVAVPVPSGAAGGSGAAQAFRLVPVAILKPLIGTTAALQKALHGARRSFES